MLKKIIWFSTPKNAAIRQMYYRGLEYAFVSQKNEQCHPFIFCKDFLHDVIYSSIYKTPISIYDFSFNEKNPTPDLNQTKLLLTNAKDKFFKNKIPNCLEFINQIESHLKIKKTIATQCINCPEGYEKTQIFLFQGSKRWLQSPPMLSLYSLLLRIGLIHENEKSFLETLENIKSGNLKPYQKQDTMYLKRCELGISKILTQGDRNIFPRKIMKNYPVMDIKDIHNKLGIVHFSVDCLRNAVGAPVIVPLWHSKEKGR